MSVDQPSRTTFWRLALLVTACPPALAAWQVVGLAGELGVDLRASRSWMGLLLALAALGSAALLALALTRSRAREALLAILESPEKLGWVAVAVLPAALAGYSALFLLPGVPGLMVGLGWVRALAFWLFSLAGMYSLRACRRRGSWFASLVLVVLVQGALHLLVSQLSGISAYPFSMGWSETSRYYYPALFHSEEIFGTRLPWPILHPSLHFLLLPPYLAEAPLWGHRAWQAAIRLALLGTTALFLVRRVEPRERAYRPLVWVWMLLFLFQGPVYFHLAVPALVVLWGFSPGREARTWSALALASAWSGVSRINWYPVPGMLAAALYLLEVPLQGQKPLRYLLKPALWFVAGLAIALASQRAYIALSGIPDPEFFYTSLSSNLLWYRLFPNASYQYGVLPAAVLASLPPWAAMLGVLRRGRLHPFRAGLLLAVVLVLFAGGLVVSMKIGGGVDIHNLDAYLVVLLVVTAYLVFGRYAPEGGGAAAPARLHWGLLAGLVAVPVWFAAQGGVALKGYNPLRTDAVLASLQSRVGVVEAQDGEVLFINQRHLVSMGMLEHTGMVVEYEREELMEMAMGDNQDYLAFFRREMQEQRFDLIVVDPLNYRLLGRNYPFGEENNAWAQRVMKPILCNYRAEAIFAQDQVALYVPQEGERRCP